MDVMIVLNYNDHERTIKYTKTIAGYKLPLKIVVVDNKSTDDSYERLVESCSQENDVIRTEKNGGYSYGNNCGIIYARDKYGLINNYIISNTDITVSKDSINRLILFMNDHDFVAAATGLVRNSAGDIVKDFAWNLPTYANLLQKSLPLTHVLFEHLFHKTEFISRSIAQDHQVIFCEAIPGCFFIVKANLFDQIGMFDEGTFLYFEENIVGWKLKKLGFTSAILTSESIIHEVGATIDRSNRGSLLKKYRHLLDSETFYVRNYLACTKKQIILLRILFLAGLVERNILFFFHRK